MGLSILSKKSERNICGNLDSECESLLRYYDPEMGRWISSEPNIDSGEFDEGFEILNSNLANAANGSNQIHTTINGVKNTIRFYVSNGEVQSINAMTGWATRIIGKLL